MFKSLKRLFEALTVLFDATFKVAKGIDAGAGMFQDQMEILRAKHNGELNQKLADLAKDKTINLAPPSIGKVLGHSKT